MQAHKLQSKDGSGKRTRSGRGRTTALKAWDRRIPGCVVFRTSQARRGCALKGFGFRLRIDPDGVFKNERVDRCRDKNHPKDQPGKYPHKQRDFEVCQWLSRSHRPGFSHGEGNTRQTRPTQREEVPCQREQQLDHPVNPGGPGETRKQIRSFAFDSPALTETTRVAPPAQASQRRTGRMEQKTFKINRLYSIVLYLERSCP